MQKKLLDYALLTPKELDWLDDYHNTVRALPISFCYTLLDLLCHFCARVRLKVSPLVLDLTFLSPGLGETTQAGGG